MTFLLGAGKIRKLSLGGVPMPRKIRSDIKIGNLEKKLGIPAGSFRHPSGRDMRSDKLLGTLRKESAKKKQK